MNGLWLILPVVLSALMSGPKGAVTEEIFAKFYGNSDTVNSRILTIAGEVAQIEVKGVLTKNRDYYAHYYGGGNTTYGELIQALNEANALSGIKKIVMLVDSPGGTIDGLFDAVAVLQASVLPIYSVVTGQACSAAYVLAAQGKSIVANNAACTVGSIGVIVKYGIDDSVITIASSNAPNKAPDPSTEEGKKIIQAHLDGIHDLFVGAVAEGRKTTKDKINSEYGKGGVCLAAEALKKGMIDSIATGATSVSGNKQSNEEGSSMDLITLKAQHPGVYAAAFAEGVAQENDRVCAHLVFGEAGAMDTAIKAIKDKSGMTATLTAQYSLAATKKAAVGTRQQESDEAGSAANPASGEQQESNGDDGDAVFGILAGKYGVEVK